MADACCPTVLILGHSLVCRLTRHLNEGSDQRAVEDFNLTEAKVHMYGVEGRKIEELRSQDLDIVKKLNPDAVILDIGCYDLVTNDPKTVGKAIDGLIKHLLQSFPVQVVGVCLVVPCPGLEKLEAKFKSIGNALNQYIKTSANSSPNVFPWAHRGFNASMWEPDKTDLNKTGQYTLYKSYRGAVIKSLEVLQGLHPTSATKQLSSPVQSEGSEAVKRSSSPVCEGELPPSRRRRSESPFTTVSDAPTATVAPVVSVSSPAMAQLVRNVTEQVTQAVLSRIQQSPPTSSSVIPVSCATLASSATSNTLGPDNTSLSPQTGIPIGSCLPEDIKTKIWKDEYVDFGLLVVSNPSEVATYNINVSGKDADAPMLTLEPNYKPKPIPNIEVWTSAFHIFVGVYTLKHPQQAPALMKYAETVRNLASNDWNWKYYDENFRLLRQSNPQSFPWGDIHWELWLFAQTKQSQPTANKAKASKPKSKEPVSLSNSEQPPVVELKPQPQQVNKPKSLMDEAINQTSQRPLFVPPGYCIKHHRGVGCKVSGDKHCPFKHKCPLCEGKHRMITCPQRRQDMTRFM